VLARAYARLSLSDVSSLSATASARTDQRPYSPAVAPLSGNMDDDFEDFDAEDVGTPNPELDDLGFIDEDVTPARKRRKDYEVEHKVIPGTELTRKVKHDIHEVTSILNVNPGIAYALLVKYHWKQERLLEEYYENETGVLVKAGVAVRHPKVPAATVGPVAGFECTICCDDDPALEVVTLMCGHQACLRCYTSYVNTKLATETDCRLRCIERKCDLIVPEDIILRCASPAMTNRCVGVRWANRPFGPRSPARCWPLESWPCGGPRYFRLQLDQYMRDHQYYKWCPAPRCERALECHISPTQLDRIVPTVKCECGNAFCFGYATPRSPRNGDRSGSHIRITHDASRRRCRCGNQDHMPATCTIAKRWLKKCADDSETANWISAHTKECPKCHATIEKNGGCNHMTCKVGRPRQGAACCPKLLLMSTGNFCPVVAPSHRPQKCKYEFCWVCQGPWTEHGSSWYQCNRFDDKKKDPKVAGTVRPPGAFAPVASAGTALTHYRLLVCAGGAAARRRTPRPSPAKT